MQHGFYRYAFHSTSTAKATHLFFMPTWGGYKDKQAFLRAEEAWYHTGLIGEDRFYVVRNYILSGHEIVDCEHLIVEIGSRNLPVLQDYYRALKAFAPRSQSTELLWHLWSIEIVQYFTKPRHESLTSIDAFIARLAYRKVTT